MFKKIGIGIVSLSLLFGFNVNASAKSGEPTKKVLYKKEEIKDLNVLYDLAIHKKSDINENNNKFKSKVKLKNEQTNEETTIDTVSTTQLLQSTEVSNGVIENNYATTVFAIVDPVTAASTGGSQYRYKWDTSLGVKAYSTYYYTSYTLTGGSNPGEYQHLDQATGGWQVDDTSIILSNRTVVLGATGASYPTTAYKQHSQTYTPSGNTFNYLGDQSWEAISINFGSVGVSTTVTLKRGTSSTWTLKLDNNCNS